MGPWTSRKMAAAMQKSTTVSTRDSHHGCLRKGFLSLLKKSKVHHQLLYLKTQYTVACQTGLAKRAHL